MRSIALLCAASILLAINCIPEHCGAQSTDTAREVRFVSAANLNMRAEPQTEGRIVAQLPQGHAVVQLGRQGEWARVAAFKPGTEELIEGWVMEHFLTKTQAGASTRGQRPPGRFDDDLQIDDVRLDCKDSFLDDGLESCTIEVDLSLQGPSWVRMEVQISCSADVRVTDATGWSQNKSGDVWETLHVSNGFGNTTVSIDIDRFSYGGDPVTQAKLTNVDCRIG